MSVMCVLVIPATSQNLKNKDETLHRLFEEITNFERSQNKTGTLYRGQHPVELGFDTVRDFEERLENYRQFSNRLDSFDRSELSPDDLISLETMELKIDGQVDQLAYKSYYIPFNAEGGFYNRLSGAIRRLPFEDQADYEAFLVWLPGYSTYLQAHLELMRQGIKEGVKAPKIIVDNAIDHVRPLVDRANPNHFLKLPFEQRKESIPDSAWRELKLRYDQIMADNVWPSYEALLHFLENEYYPVAYDSPGIDQIPNGEDYYEARLRYFTTLDLTADEVYERGLNEVQRIRMLMGKVIDEVNFDGDFASFLEYLRTDSKFYAATGQELLSYAAWLSKKAEGKLPGLFDHLYELPFTVAPVPDDIAPTYTGGRYVPGRREQDRPGTYWVNTYNLPARSLYNLPALTLHEAVPGHHLQMMISAELKDLPSFRNRFYISAFGEGWGLYAEYLGEEMGMYESPYDYFGRLTYEMWRACRLVVDVGLHVKGWSREQAIEFLSSNTALSMHEVTTEIDRYIGWPGQALSYKVGELKIKELRKNAEAELADKFDIKDFHYQVLRNGSVPLPTLERIINSWIEEVKKG